MSAKIMGQVYDLDLPANEQSVLLAMADHSDHEGGNVYPSNGLVAWKIGVSEDTVARVKKKLQERGILVLEAESPGHVKRYRINIAAGAKKTPYEQGRRSGNLTPPTSPQIAGTFKPNLPATGNPTSPQPEADTPPTSPHSCAARTGTRTIIGEPSSAGVPPAPFSLEHPVAAPKAETSPSRKFSDAWCAAFKERFGTPYLYTTADGVQASRLLKVVAPEQIIAAAKEAWRQTDASVCWACVHQSSSVAKFVGAWANITAELKRARERKAAASQMRVPKGNY